MSGAPNEATETLTAEQLEQLGELIVWGVKRGWELLHTPVDILFTADGLGFTHPATYGEAKTIFVNPRALTTPNGPALLRALILHEIGHHLYQFADQAYPAIHRQAKYRHRVTSVLNLLEDEHLERRLRSHCPAWGEHFDALASWAFKGESLEAAIEDYAALAGFESADAAREALNAGHAPGTIVCHEAGYTIHGGNERGGLVRLLRRTRRAEREWVSGPELVTRLFDTIVARAHDGVEPPHIAAARRELLDEARRLRGTPGRAGACHR
jgi:hypothetical protein